MFLVSKSSRMRGILRRLDALTSEDGPVLLVGEEGTGLIEAARRVHDASDRRRGPLIVMDCRRLEIGRGVDLLVGTVPCSTDLDALPQGMGALNLAHGGTLVLRNLDCLPADDQAVFASKLKAAVIGVSVTDVRIVATAGPLDGIDHSLEPALREFFPKTVERRISKVERARHTS